MPMLNLALRPASSVGRASCPSFVTPDFDPGVAPASRNCLKNNEAVGIVARIPHPVSLSQRAREVQNCPGSTPSPSGRGLG